MADVPPPTDKPATGNAPAAGSPGAGSSDAGAVADGKAKAHASRVFLVVVDETEEMRVALRFAARRAHSTGGKVAMLYVVEPSAFQHWMSRSEERRGGKECGITCRSGWSPYH